MTYLQLRMTFAAYIEQHFDLQSSKLIIRALELAEQAHQGQIRDDDKPYIEHPLRVALSLMRELHIYDVDLICAALLHDIVEDQKVVSPDFLKLEFGCRISRLVENLTKPDKSSKTRDEINRIYFDRLSQTDDESKIIKLIDKLDNVRDAVHCPSPEKRNRTIAEARDFYLPLASRLRNTHYRNIIMNLLNTAIQTDQ